MTPRLEDVRIAERAKARLLEQFTPVPGDEFVARLVACPPCRRATWGRKGLGTCHWSPANLGAASLFLQ